MPTYYVANMLYSSELYHFGIKGQRWGVRRYQYEDGTLTPLGKEHYKYLTDSQKNDIYQNFVRGYNKNWAKVYNKATGTFNSKIWEINRKYDGVDLSDSTSQIGQRYVKEVDKMWREAYVSALGEYAETAKTMEIGEQFVNSVPFMNAIIEASAH